VRPCGPGSRRGIPRGSEALSETGRSLPTMRRVCVIGAGSTKYGRLKETGREMLTEAIMQAFASTELDPRQVDGAFFGNAFAVTERQGHLGPLIMSALGIPDKPASTVESACASGGTAVREAFINIAGGFADVMIAGGVEKVSQLDTLTATSYFAYGSDFAFEGGNGCSFPGLYATMAVAHMGRYGTTEEDLAHIAVKNHANGAKNPKAHLQKAIKIDDVLKSMVVAAPLKLYDACPFSDGAAAVILASEEVAKKLTDEPVYIAGSGRAGSIAALHDRDDLTTIPGTKLATQQALKMAKLELKDVDFAEVHDCFTIAEAIATEDIGFFKHGTGHKQAREGVTANGGKIPINPSGGLKAKGHPVGATGVGQVAETYWQLLGEAGGLQVSGAEVGLTHNVGATGGSVAVHVLRRGAS